MENNNKIEWYDNDKKVVISGILDEFFDYDQLFTRLPSEVWIDMENIERLNSCGIREWLRRIINCRSRIHFLKCPSAIIDQISLVPHFTNAFSSVDSFYIIHRCDECADEKKTLLKVGEDIEAGLDEYFEFDEIECQNCGSTMSFSHDPDFYFSFLATSSKKAS